MQRLTNYFSSILNIGWHQYLTFHHSIPCHQIDFIILFIKLILFAFCILENFIIIIMIALISILTGIIGLIGSFKESITICKTFMVIMGLCTISQLARLSIIGLNIYGIVFTLAFQYVHLLNKQNDHREDLNRLIFY